jgi:hypothetical protein
MTRVLNFSQKKRRSSSSFWSSGFAALLTPQIRMDNSIDVWLTTKARNIDYLDFTGIRE